MPEMKTKAELAKELADTFESLEGRRPRMYLAGITKDDDTHLKKILATVFADMGWDVDVGPEDDTPEGAARDASDNDVHVIGFFAPDAAALEHFAPLMEALAKDGRDDITAFLFGSIPEARYEELFSAGACAIFGAGSDLQDGCLFLLKLLVESAREEGE